MGDGRRRDGKREDGRHGDRRREMRDGRLEARDETGDGRRDTRGRETGDAGTGDAKRRRETGYA